MATGALEGQTQGRWDCAALIHQLKEELGPCLADARVAAQLAHSAAQALHLLGEKVEYQLQSGSEARQVTGPCNAVQQRNLQLCGLLQDVHVHVNSLLGSLPEDAAKVLSAAAVLLDKVQEECLQPLFKQFQERLEKAMLAMHKDNWSQKANADTTVCSQYMEELISVMVHFSSEFYSKLVPSSSGSANGNTDATFPGVSEALARRAAERLVTIFVRHAALLRPLSENGKLRLAKDMAELELAVGQNLYSVTQLGGSYRALRAFRPLLFLPTAQVPTSPLLQELPMSVVLHHLYTRAPENLLSPHAKAGLTAAQYSLWLDQHNEEEIWRGIRGTLDAYSQSNGTQIDDVHAIMLKIGNMH